MFSTPFTCCSSGVATDCSTSTADAPTYVVVTLIIGGTMSGNCEIGRPCITMKPTRTRTMEITIATIGRLTKNFDMGQRPPARATESAGTSVALTTMSGRTRWMPSTTTLSPGLTPFSITREGADRGPGDDPPELDLVALADDEHEVLPLDLGHRPRGNHDGAFSHVDHRDDPRKLARDEEAARGSGTAASNCSVPVAASICRCAKRRSPCRDTGTRRRESSEREPLPWRCSSSRGLLAACGRAPGIPAP